MKHLLFNIINYQVKMLMQFTFKVIFKFKVETIFRFLEFDTKADTCQLVKQYVSEKGLSDFNCF